MGDGGDITVRDEGGGFLHHPAGVTIIHPDAAREKRQRIKRMLVFGYFLREKKVGHGSRVKVGKQNAR